MQKQRFTLDHLLQEKQLADRVPLHLSPDGRWLAVTFRDVRRSRPSGHVPWASEGVPADLDGSRILLVETATGKTCEPFPSGSISWAPMWSPDGRRLAAYVRHKGTACLALCENETGAVKFLREACVRPRYGFEGPQWLPDSRRIVTKLSPSVSAPGEKPANAPGPDGPSVEVLSFDPVVAEEKAGTPEAAGYSHWRGDLALVDTHTGDVRRLACDWPFCSFRAAPDGHAVAVLRIVRDRDNLADDCFDLVAVAIADGTVRRLAPRVQQEYGYWLNWSPDCQQIAYLDLEQGQPSRLFIVPGDGSEEPRLLSVDEDMGIPLEEYYLSPRWSLDSRTVYCVWNVIWAFAADGSSHRKIAPAPGRRYLWWIQHHPTTPAVWTLDGRAILLIERDSLAKKDGLARVDLEIGEAERLTEFDGGLGVDTPFHTELAPDGSAGYFTEGRIWQRVGDFRTQKALLPLSLDFSQVLLGSKRLIEYRTVASRAEKRQAMLWLPPDYAEGQRLPVIVDLYPGVRFSAVGSGSSRVADPHLFNSRGYAVLHPDVLVHGRDMLRQLAGEVVPAVNHLVELGIADPARICLFGHSRGGHAALGLITQTDLFCAAVVSAAQVTLTSYGAGGGADYVQCETGIYACGGTPWEKRDAYIENSPFFYLDRVHTPLLVIAGTSSHYEELQARQTFHALRRLGQRVELRLYQDEDHDPGAWTETNFRDVVERIFTWFDTFA